MCGGTREASSDLMRKMVCWEVTRTGERWTSGITLLVYYSGIWDWVSLGFHIQCNSLMI